MANRVSATGEEIRRNNRKEFLDSLKTMADISLKKQQLNLQAQKTGGLGSYKDVVSTAAQLATLQNNGIQVPITAQNLLQAYQVQMQVQQPTQQVQPLQFMNQLGQAVSPDQLPQVVQQNLGIAQPQSMLTPRGQANVAEQAAKNVVNRENKVLTEQQVPPAKAAGETISGLAEGEAFTGLLEDATREIQENLPSALKGDIPGMISRGAFLPVLTKINPDSFKSLITLSDNMYSNATQYAQTLGQGRLSNQDVIGYAKSLADLRKRPLSVVVTKLDDQMRKIKNKLELENIEPESIPLFVQMQNNVEALHEIAEQVAPEDELMGLLQSYKKGN